MFCSDYPRRVVNCLWFWWFPAFDALPVASALTVALLLARRGLPVALLRLPPRPTSAPHPGTPRRNNAAVSAADGSASRIPSADRAAHAADGFDACAGQSLDFRDGVYDSREGPWEVTTPRSSGPGEEPIPLRGTADLRVTAKSKLYRKGRSPAHLRFGFFPASPRAQRRVPAPF